MLNRIRKWNFCEVAKMISDKHLSDPADLNPDLGQIDWGNFSISIAYFHYSQALRDFLRDSKHSILLR